MSRRKKLEEHENHDRWLVSYADFITLLFAFFVVMYSMSSVNEGKYRILSDSMTAAFNPTARLLTPIQVGELVRSAPAAFPLILDLPRPITIAPIISPIENPRVELPEDPEQANGNSLTLENAGSQIDSIAADVQENFESLIDSEQIIVRKSPLWLEVEVKSNILFGSGSADLAAEAGAILSGLARIFSNHSNRIIVEGYTDNLPIRSTVFPSNWELSSARAAAVIRLFESNSVASARMSSIGYGEFRPNSNNDTEVGRANNRKVIIILLAGAQGQDIDIAISDIEEFRQRGGF